MRTIAVLLLLGAAALAGCRVVATAEDYAWSVNAPAAVTIHPRARLRFTVDTRAADGRPVAEVPFVWTVDWAGVNGVEHQGWSSREHHLLVKGDAGTAVLRILAVGRHGGLVEVARREFKVEWGAAVHP